jgi:hypothetical protein
VNTSGHQSTYIEEHFFSDLMDQFISMRLNLRGFTAFLRKWLRLSQESVGGQRREPTATCSGRNLGAGPLQLKTTKKLSGRGVLLRWLRLRNVFAVWRVYFVNHSFILDGVLRDWVIRAFRRLSGKAKYN